MPDNPTRVDLHIGLPKTGTTSIQALLAENRTLLKKRGLLYPFVRPGGMFHGAVELLGWEQRFGLDPRQVRGTWETLCRRVMGFKGRHGLISHEILGRCDERQVEAALAPLRGAEVHVVVTARDLGRQLTAVYQERVKNGRGLTFGEFVEPVARDPRRGGRNATFWLEQDLTEVLRRWTASVPAERVHVVTCPPPGAAHDVLLERFAAAVGMDVAGLPRPDTRNTSIGAGNVELLRRINVELGERLPRRVYLDVVKQWFAEQVLAAHPGQRAGAPESLRTHLEDVTERWRTEITERGYQVHGDLEDLRPTGFVPDDELALSEADVLGAAPVLLGELLAEVADLRRRARDQPRGRGTPAGPGRRPG